MESGKYKDNFFSEPPSYYTRPDEILPDIDKSFQKASDDLIESGYTEQGTPEYGFMLLGFSSTSSEMLKHKLQEAQSSPLIQCDIGAGDFTYNITCNSEFKDKVITYGITAKDFRMPLERSYRPDTFIIGKNAEYFSDIFKKDVEFDFIFSRATFVHFVDPMGSLMEAYAKLKVGGVMLVDKFFLPGLEKYGEALLEYLESQGYRVLGKAEHNYITNFIIEKTVEKPKLAFPFTFSHIGPDPGVDPKIAPKRSAYYYPNGELKAVIPDLTKKNESFFQKGKELINKATLEYKSILQDCPDLPSLFSNKDYLELPNVKQNLLILQVVANNYKNYCDKNKIIEDGNKEDNTRWKNFASTIAQGLRSSHMQNFTTLFYLPFDRLFLANSPEQQKRLIEFFAIEHLYMYGKAEVTREKLKEMKIPFKEENHTYENSLSYSKIAELKKTYSEVGHPIYHGRKNSDD